MCGIVGYTGKSQAAPILLDGLKKLEYRGYDSAGIAVSNDNGIDIAKTTGSIAALYTKTDNGKSLSGYCGIGHSRWATHGVPTELNAHPHHNDEKTLAVVHNGIIENYTEIKDELLSHGYSFYSQTDTEVATKLIDFYYKKYGNPLKAVSAFAGRASGSYAIAAIFAEYKNELYAIRKDSPMVVGIAGDDCILASDVVVLLPFTREVAYIENLQPAVLREGKIHLYDLDGNSLKVSFSHVDWDMDVAEKGGFEHFMLKEIHEQPQVIKNTVSYFTRGGDVDFTELNLTDAELKAIDGITVVGCGSAYHVGLVMQYVTEDIAKVPVRVELASEFRYRSLVLSQNNLIVLISQSGETADTIAALRQAKAMGKRTLAIVNVVGSTIAREADHVLYIKAGPEISVATTKAYSAQLVATYLIALKLGRVRGILDDLTFSNLLAELYSLPEKITKILADTQALKSFAAQTANKTEAFFIGRGIDYAVSVEGSLKLKEISYIHSEAYAAGELKHGTISLIEDGTLVIGVITQDKLMEKTLSNLEETNSRKASVAVIATEGRELPAFCNKVFRIPATDNRFSASLAVVPLQLYAYYLCTARGNDVDKPRNLAKSVTVE